jgi:hypothetical protein
MGLRGRRRPLGLVVLVATCGIAATSESRSGNIETAHASALAVIRNLRVCAKAAFNESERCCTKDQRRTPLVSSFFACSADVVVRRSSRLRLQWTYEGADVPAFIVTVSRRYRRYWLYLDVGADFPLPGGSYRCGFAVGHAKKTANFKSAGPTGDAVDLAACDGANTNDYGGFLICRYDESARPISASTSIVCNAVYPNATGKTSAIEILRDGQLVAPPKESHINAPLRQVDNSFAAPHGMTLKAGNYECRFSLDHTVVAHKQFEIAQPAPGRPSLSSVSR